MRTFSRDNVFRWFLFSLSSTRIKFIFEKSTARHANLQAVNSREYARLLLQFSVVTKSQENIAVVANSRQTIFLHEPRIRNYRKRERERGGRGSTNYILPSCAINECKRKKKIIHICHERFSLSIQSFFSPKSLKNYRINFFISISSIYYYHELY